MAQEMSEVVKNCKVLLLDIEGTTTSICFVKDKLFPYAAENVKQFLESKWETDEVKSAVEGLRKLAIEDEKKKVEGLVAIPGADATKEEQIEGLVNNVKWHMSSDRKEGALKHLQGLIWQQGYDNGDIKGHVYPDVPEALKQWRALSDDRKIYIYSSGSVQAQKLLFGKSDLGDLLEYIDGHFDTEVGSKQDIESYKKIVEKIGVQADSILFLTDIVKEAEAAVGAGMKSIIVSRTDEKVADAADFIIITSMADMYTAKRKLIEETEESVKPSKVAKTEEPVEELEVTKNGTEPAAPSEDVTSEGKSEKVVNAKTAEEIIIEELASAAAEESTTPEEEITPVVIEDAEMAEVEEKKPEEKLEKIVEDEKSEEPKVDIEIEELPVTKEDAPLEKTESNGDTPAPELNGKSNGEKVNGTVISEDKIEEKIEAVVESANGASGEHKNGDEATDIKVKSVPVEEATKTVEAVKADGGDAETVTA